MNFVTAAFTPIEPLRGNIAPDDVRHKPIPHGDAKPKKHVARMQAQLLEGPQGLERSPDRYGAYVGADPTPLTAVPPAFLH